MKQKFRIQDPKDQDPQDFKTEQTLKIQDLQDLTKNECSGYKILRILRQNVKSHDAQNMTAKKMIIL